MDEETSKKHLWMKSGLFRYIPFANVGGIMLGGIGGYIYYLKVVCVTGGCPLTSNPIITIVWGGALGYLFSDLFRKRKSKKE
jgi:2-keto-3-deoxy-6-phosphogluconate aldolase